MVVLWRRANQIFWLLFSLWIKHRKRYNGNKRRIHVSMLQLPVTAALLCVNTNCISLSSIFFFFMNKTKVAYFIFIISYLLDCIDYDYWLFALISFFHFWWPQIQHYMLLYKKNNVYMIHTSIMIYTIFLFSFSTDRKCIIGWVFMKYNFDWR